MADEESTGTRDTTGGTIDVQQAARLLMLDPRRIQQLAAEGYIERAAQGRYRTVSVVQGYIRFLKDSIARSQQNVAENRVRDARAREIELRNAKADHALIDYAEAEGVLDEVAGLLKSEFDGFGARMTRDMTMRRKIEAGIDDIFARAAARITETLASLRATGEVVEADDEDDT